MLVAAVIGRPAFADAGSSGLSPAAILMQLWRARGPGLLQQVHGTCALAVLDNEGQTAFLAIDRIGSQSLAFAARSDGIVFSDRAGAVASHPDVGLSLDPQGLFHYFYFREVPAPGSAYRGVEKLLPVEQSLWRQGRAGQGRAELLLAAALSRRAEIGLRRTVGAVPSAAPGLRAQGKGR
jgi:asparagine synthase (glutamine-hydrolysing)